MYSLPIHPNVTTIKSEWLCIENFNTCCLWCSAYQIERKIKLQKPDIIVMT